MRTYPVALTSEPGNTLLVFSFPLVPCRRENTVESCAYNLRDLLKRGTLADTLAHSVEMILEDLRNEAITQLSSSRKSNKAFQGAAKHLSCRIP